MKYTDNSVAIGSKQHACMSTTQLAIWPVGTVMISRRGLTSSHHNILCVHADDRARLSVDSTS